MQASLQAWQDGAIRRLGVDPGVNQELHPAEDVANRVPGHVGAQSASDRPLAVLMDDDLEAPHERLGIMEMERPSEAAFVVEKLELVFGTRESVPGRGLPDLADLEDGPRRVPPVRKKPAQLE